MDFELDQDSRTGKSFSNITQLWDGRLDAATPKSLCLRPDVRM